MSHVSRRGFLGGVMGTAAAGYLSRGALELSADPLGMPIGCQSWPVRDALAKDFPGTLKQLAGIGFRTLEMCSPPGYATSGFGPLAKMKAAEIRQAIDAAGLRCESSHFQFRELRESLDDRIAWSKEMGLTQMVLSTFGLPNNAAMADWMRAADELNKIGEQTQKAGIQLGFHNHNFEFQTIDGVLVYDKLMGQLDAKLVKMQFQVAVVSLGYEAATYLTKYPGRFLSLHLADWSAAEKKQVAIGKGVVDWVKLFAAARTGGVKNYFVEMDRDLMKASIPYLHALKA
ncbi:MAG: TIM barrel protein [Bryobacteraceae bacterium]|jgi:sugar phosphate isomerase/epimerase